MDAALPFTEQQDPLTLELDSPDVGKRVRLLAESDRGLLAGVRGFPSVLDAATVEACVRAADLARSVMHSRRGEVVLAGAGTSGRIAFLLARLVNERLSHAGRRPGVHPLIAGGPRALAHAVEGAEDDLEAAKRDVERVLPRRGPNLFVGITCGLSAPWVAGGLLAALAAEDTSVVLLGFNPIDRARPAFRPVAERVASSERGMCILPVLGPEPLAGSTRMKGGSATLLLLASILDQAVLERRPDPIDDMRVRLARYEAAIDPFGNEGLQEGLTSLATAAGWALLASRSIVYLGAGLPAILAQIDASECPPTFGADRWQVRALVQGGWPATQETAEERGRPVAGDLTIECLGSALRWRVDGAPTELWLGPSHDELTRLMRIKLALNVVSTCAFVSAGKVFGNRMVDLRLSNTKLFFRAVRIVAEMAGVPEEAAHLALLGAIHRTDAPGRDLVRMPVAAHVEAAAAAEKVVPLAILTAGAGLGLADAEALLAREPLVRRALESALPRRG